MTLDIDLSIDIAKEREKPRLVAILFYDNGNQTDDRKITLAGMFDRLFVDLSEKKTVPFGIFVRTAKTFDAPVRVAIVSPDNKVVGGFTFTTYSKDAPKGEKPNMTQLVGRVRFNAPVEGDYWFDVSFNGQSLGGCPLKVEFKDLKELIDGYTRGDA